MGWQDYHLWQFEAAIGSTAFPTPIGPTVISRRRQERQARCADRARDPRPDLHL
ncbi:hypothetical protein [Croceicoccus naphthovorans]